MKEAEKKEMRKCSHCNKKIEDPDINYCLFCNNILWDEGTLGKKIR